MAYKNGEVWAEDVVKTIGEAAQVLMKADRATIQADRRDLSFITVLIADQNGLIVPRAKHLLRFAITEPVAVTSR